MEAVLRMPDSLLKESWYTPEEFISLLEDFLEKKFWGDITILYKVDEQDLPEEVRDSFNNMEKKNFTNPKKNIKCFHQKII
jgi:hypothetical protein